MMQSVLILDCGATNVKACLVEESGKIISSVSEPNNTSADPYFKGGLIWDIDGIFRKFSSCIRQLRSADTEIVAITATSFGVDGALLSEEGKILYPVISWQCSRTQESETHIGNYFQREQLYNETGLQSYHFNTINKLIWMKENRPELLTQNSRFLLMPSLILWWLCGEMVTDATMAGTTMLTSLIRRRFSDHLLHSLKLEPELFPPLKEPGAVAGKLTKQRAGEFGLPAGIPVVVTGHDTQFALLGAGAGVDIPVLSSGTWEILMSRTNAGNITLPSVKEGVTVELDAIPGIVDPGVQYVASGVIEWLSKMLFSEVGSNKKYPAMVAEAEKIDAGSDGLLFIPELFPGSFSGKKGTIEGLNHNISRAHIYRAALESLCYYLRYALQKLTKMTHSNPGHIICVGGGSKNPLWNRIRASVVGIPIHVPEITEATATGAAIFAFTAAGVFKSVSEAAGTLVKSTSHEYLPGDDKELYNDLYHKFVSRVF